VIERAIYATCLAWFVALVLYEVWRWLWGGPWSGW
jgi:hypothetical protein